MSSPAEDRPPPPRDPLDDPAFAELVDPPPKTTAEPVYAEPAETPVESLPVAEVIRPKAAPLPAKETPKFPAKTSLPTPVQTEPPRPQWFMACGVIGCLGVLVIASVATLIWIAITLMSGLSDKIGDTKAETRGQSPDKIARGPLAPTTLAADTDLPLPGRVDAVARGGGGRFLLLRIPRERHIHVFDVNTARIVHRIPIREPGSLFTASADKIFTCDPLDKTLHRYSLYSGDEEASEKLPNDVTRVLAIATGSGETNGALHLFDGRNMVRMSQFDPTTLKFVKAADLAFGFGADPASVVLARSSDNGKLLCVSVPGGAFAVSTPVGGATTRILCLTPAVADRAQWGAPSPDGQYFYTSKGVFDSGGVYYAAGGKYCFPAASGNDWYLTLDVEGGMVEGRPLVRKAGSRNLAKAPELDKVFLDKPFPANTPPTTLPVAERIHWWPAAGLAAVLPESDGGPEILQLFKMPVDVK